MIDDISHCTVMVRDQEEALAFYEDVLDFEIEQDFTLESGARWLAVTPHGASSLTLVLAQAETPEQKEVVGQQLPGEAGFVLTSENVRETYSKLVDQDVEADPPMDKPWGEMIRFWDLYGNRFCVIES